MSKEERRRGKKGVSWDRRKKRSRSKGERRGIREG